MPADTSLSRNELLLRLEEAIIARGGEYARGERIAASGGKQVTAFTAVDELIGVVRRVFAENALPSETVASVDAEALRLAKEFLEDTEAREIAIRAVERAVGPKTAGALREAIVISMEVVRLDQVLRSTRTEIAPMKQRPRGFLNDLRRADPESFDYIKELHQFWWRAAKAMFPGASGDVGDYIPRIVAKLESSAPPTEQATSPLGDQGHNAPCYYCGEPCNTLAGNPGEWPIPLCHRDDPGRVKWHHSRCVHERLIENATPSTVEERGPVAFIWHDYLGAGTKSLRWTEPHPMWDSVSKVTPLYDAPSATKENKDEARLLWLETLFKHCPHAELIYNDEEGADGPEGFSLHVQGCATLALHAPTLDALIDLGMTAEADEDGNVIARADRGK